MNNELTLGKRSNLIMPTHYVELDEEEMAYIDGGDFYISNSSCRAVVGAISGGVYVGGSCLAAAVMSGIVSRAMIYGTFANIVSKVAIANAWCGGILAVVGKFAIEVFINMCIAVCQGKQVVIETLKIWKWDLRIPCGVNVC